MVFQGDALEIVKIMIFCNNQSSYIRDKWSPYALCKTMSSKSIRHRRNFQEKAHENLRNILF